MRRIAQVAFLSLLAAAFVCFGRGWREGIPLTTTEAAPLACSLDGTFAYSMDGELLVVERGHVVFGGLMTFSGGRISGHDTVNYVSGSKRRTFTGSYSIEPDCSGVMKLSFTSGDTGGTAMLDFYVANGGRELRLVQTDKGRLAVGTATKQ